MQEEIPVATPSEPVPAAANNQQINTVSPVFPEEAPIFPEEVKPAEVKKEEAATAPVQQIVTSPIQKKEEYIMPPKSPSNNLLIYLTLFLIIVAVLGFLAWKFVFGEKIQESFFSQPTPTVQVQITPTVAVDPTANWKTYKNEKWGYEIKYPSEEFDVSKTDGYLTLKNSTAPATQAIVFMGIDNPQNLDLTNWVSQEQASQSAELINSGILIPNTKIPSVQEYTINNIKWIGIPKYFGFVPSGYFYYVTVADKKIIFLGTINLDFEKYKTTILQILSTFKFAEKTENISVTPIATVSGILK